ncbi:MAG TPA: hypothetical protein VFN78_15380 [Ktedonobacterales bacterium]|nr:hypothetical protein [Ktedonobacterales bacterium]
MTTPPHLPDPPIIPPTTTETEEIGPLTPGDETALDRAWATITDEDIATSIRWLEEIKRKQQQQPPKQRPGRPNLTRFSQRD